MFILRKNIGFNKSPEMFFSQKKKSFGSFRSVITSFGSMKNVFGLLSELKMFFYRKETFSDLNISVLKKKIENKKNIFKSSFKKSKNAEKKCFWF